jgi:phosphoglycerate kinase
MLDNYSNKTVLLRVDLNVPVSEGIILDDSRITKVIPTIKYLLARGAKVILASHFARPKGIRDPKFSLEFLLPHLINKLALEVLFCSDAVGDKAKEMAANLKAGQVMLLENLRFYLEEEKNDAEFAAQLAELADYYVNDAFSCSHRSHASIDKITEFLPSSAGLLLLEEIGSLNRYLSHPAQPMLAIIGGSKISTKLTLLKSLVKKVDYLVIVGAMANTFIKAKGYEIGNSFYEEALLPEALDLLNYSCKIILPQDVVVVKKIEEKASNWVVKANSIPKDKMAIDIGPAAIAEINALLERSKTLVMNGPVGVFEYFPFSVGTISVARQIVKLTNAGELVSVAGGGDIVAALSEAGLVDQFSYVSTAGGAFLEWLEGKELPGIKALAL